jgi:cold shock CspA family protein
MQGILMRFDENSGVGRITSDDGIQLLMHKTSIDSNPSPLKLGQTVEFRIGRSHCGKRSSFAVIVL